MGDACDDRCLNTVIPETAPTNGLGANRWALLDGDLSFDTTLPAGGGSGLAFTLDDTAGCSCEQIIIQAGLSVDHKRFGCSTEAMQSWVTFVNHP